MFIKKNIVLPGKNQKPVLIDVFFKENEKPKQVVIFCHGYKGFKDWGAWNLVAKHFAEENIFFVKMNFSHNGGTVEQPIDFPDLEAFGNNNFLKELDDVDTVLNWVFENNAYKKEIDTAKVSLIGHSRGGGIVLIKAAEDNRISKVITWAGVSDFGSRFPSGEQLSIWEKDGVAYILNGRTKQQMPHYFQFYTSFKENEQRLNVKNAVKRLNVPYMVIHGLKDETVPVKEAENLFSWNSKNQILVLEGANHSFGSIQPWKKSDLPVDLEKVVEKSIRFLQKN